MSTGPAGPEVDPELEPGDGVVVPELPEVAPPSGRAWLARPATITALMHARFPDGLSTTSQPSLEQVTELIELVAASIVAACDEPGPAQFALAKATCALGVAAYIENSAYPEQTDLTVSPGEFYRRRYSEHVDTLRRAIVTDTRPYLVGYSIPVYEPLSAVNALPGE